MRIPFQNSIQGKLIFSFAIMSVLITVIAAFLAFRYTYKETEKLQDDLLQQIAAYQSPVTVPHNLPDSDNEARIFVQNSNYPDVIDLPLTNNLPSGLSTIEYNGDSYRVFIKNMPQGRIIVSQENEYRDLMAKHSAWDSAMPLLILIPLTAILMFLLIQSALRPIKLLSGQVEIRQAQDLTPLATNDVPLEFKGFLVEINRLLSRIETMVQQQKRFIADAAHELRSPMTALSIQAERLGQQLGSDKGLPQFIELREGIQRNRNLLDQLLSLARIQNRDKTLTLQPVAISQIFSQVITDLWPLAESKEQDLGVTSIEEVTMVASEFEIYTLIKTLTDNAIRYTPTGGQIDLSASQCDGQIIIIIEDNGIGIPDGEKERVFDPFYRVNQHSSLGSGLGISIANTIAEYYDGKITLSDSVHFNSGLLVTIVLSQKNSI